MKSSSATRALLNPDATRLEDLDLPCGQSGKLGRPIGRLGIHGGLLLPPPVEDLLQRQPPAFGPRVGERPLTERFAGGRDSRLVPGMLRVRRRRADLLAQRF